MKKLLLTLLIAFSISSLYAEGLGGQNISGGFPPLGFSTATSDIVRPRLIKVPLIDDYGDGSIGLNWSNGSGTTLSGSIFGTTNQVNVSSNSNSVGQDITLSLPQSIAVTSSPVFTGLYADSIGITNTATADIVTATTRITTVGTATADLVDAVTSVRTPIIFPVSNSTTALQIKDALQSKTLMTFDTNGKIGIGTIDPGAVLDVVGGVTNTIGIRIYNTLADATNKDARLASMPYTNVTGAGASVVMIEGFNTSTDNGLYWGGGSGTQQSVTSQRFYTAAAVGTLTGTERMRINGNGNIGIGTTVPNSLLSVGSTEKFKVDSSGFATSDTVCVKGTSFDTYISNPNATSTIAYLLPLNSGTSGQVLSTNGASPTATLSWATASGGSMVYPGAGIANSTGAAWGTSYTTSGSGTVVALTNTPVFTTPSLGAATGTSVNLSGVATADTVDVVTSARIPVIFPISNSTTALKIQDALRVKTILTFDTTNNRVNLGSSLLTGNSSTSGIAINSSGNVGIGTTAPTQLLDVQGNSIEVADNTVTFTDVTDGYVLTFDTGTNTWAGEAAGGGGAPTDATYITQTANGTLSAEQALGALATGILKSTTTTGVVSIAVAGTDYQAPLTNPMVYGDTRFAILSISRDCTTASGNVAYTGAGFQPKLVIFQATEQNTKKVTYFGYDTGSAAACLMAANSSTADQIQGGFSTFHTTDATPTDTYSVIASMDADGFTLTWTKRGSDTGTFTVRALCFR